jgi:hypothetical protein
MRNKSIATLIGILALTLASSAQAASLLGEQLVLEHQFNRDVYGTTETTVTADSSDAAFMQLGYTYIGDRPFPAGYTIDVNPYSISVRMVFQGLTTVWNGGSPNGLVLRSDLLDIPTMLSTLIVQDVGDFHMTSDRVSAYGNNGVLFQFANLNASTGIGFDAQWENPSAVPEPTSWGLMILGFGGMGAMLRRRRSLEGLTIA